MDSREQNDYLPIFTHYSLPRVSAIEVRDSGMNNTTRYAVLEDGSVRVLRVYENHRDAAKLRTEHKLLLRLRDRELPFAVPCPIRTASGSTWVEAPSGKPAALFTYLEGARPAGERRDLAAEYGRTVGRLVQALEGLELAEPPAYPAYDELLDTPPMELEAVAAAFHRSPALADAAEDADYLLRKLTSLRNKADEIRGLPRQLIHGDVSYANVLAEGNTITAVLDFEFATRDLRAMELAVCLAEQLSVPGALSANMAREMIAGYESVLPLEEAERRMLPFLVQLRKLDVFLHFWRRHEAGLDPAEVLIEQTKRSARVSRYLDRSSL